MFQTITIPAGQTAYLPNTAKIISITSTGGATASSDCLDLTVEPLGCYGFVAADQNDNSNRTEPFQSNNTFYTGIRANGVDYLFDTEVSYDDSQNTLANTIMNLPGIGSVLIEVKVQDDFDSNYGNRFFIIFKTVPSIAADLYLINRTALVWGDDINMKFLIPARTYSDITTEHGTTNVPTCQP